MRPRRSRRRFAATWLVVGLLIGAGLTRVPWARVLRRGHPPRIPVTVRIDYGPAARPMQEAQLLVDAGSTPKDALSLLVPVLSGEVCCDTREVAAIDGIRPDPVTNRWWTCQLNDSTKISPFRVALKPGDVVEWRYRESPQ